MHFFCGQRAQLTLPEVSAREGPQHGALRVPDKHPGWKSFVLRKELLHELSMSSTALWVRTQRDSTSGKTFCSRGTFRFQRSGFKNDPILTVPAAPSPRSPLPAVISFIFVGVCPFSFQEAELGGWRLGLSYSLRYPWLLE